MLVSSILKGKVSAQNILQIIHSALACSRSRGFPRVMCYKYHIYVINRIEDYKKEKFKGLHTALMFLFVALNLGTY